MSDNIRLSRDAASLLVRIYQRYLNSKRDGMTDLQSRYIGDTLNVIHLFSLIHDPAFVTDLLFELDDAGYIEASLGNNLANECVLTREGIARMETLWIRFLGSLTKSLTSKALGLMLQALS
ncbi:MAG: hypothetical protein IJ418_09230 [Clostridia bacterium]|nr:hypothetical protein [Clostridia bacterium]